MGKTQEWLGLYKPINSCDRPQKKGFVKSISAWEILYDRKAVTSLTWFFSHRLRCFPASNLDTMKLSSSWTR